jgi:hypothetical protein
MAHYSISAINEKGLEQDALWELIFIKSIIFDKGMIKKAKEMIIDLKSKKIKVFPKTNIKSQGFDLYKWDEVNINISSNIALDPINIKKYNETDYYEVIQGRHRVVSSLYNGHTQIPAFILSI